MRESELRPNPDLDRRPAVVPELPRKRVRAVRRQALLEAAEYVFAERGFTGATMAEIAARAGYSAGNLYNVFEGKEALFLEVLTSRADQVLELVRKALRHDEPLGRVIDRYLEACLQLVEAHRGFFVMLTQTSPDFDWHTAPGAGNGGLRADLDQQLEGVFLRAMDRGEIPRGDPQPCVCLLQGTLNSHAARWVRANGSRDDLWGPADGLRTLLKRGLGIE
jgi:AcrR family transcriptional regulator